MGSSQRMIAFRLRLEPNASGVYTVTSPDVPGLVTEGRTPEEILHNVQEALDKLRAAWENLGIDPPPALQKEFHVPRTVEMLVTV